MDLIDILQHDGPQGWNLSITVASHRWISRLHPEPSSCTVHFVKQLHHAWYVLPLTIFHVLPTPNLAHIQDCVQFLPFSIYCIFSVENPEKRSYVTKLANFVQNRSKFAWSPTIAMCISRKNLGSIGVGQKKHVEKVGPRLGRKRPPRSSSIFQPSWNHPKCFV